MNRYLLFMPDVLRIEGLKIEGRMSGLCRGDAHLLTPGLIPGHFPPREKSCIPRSRKDGYITSRSEDQVMTDEEPVTEQTSDAEYEEEFAYFLVMLRDENVGKRWKAAESLARTGDTRSVEPLIAALEDEDWRVRQKAAWALGYIGDPRALVPLRRAMMYESDSVRSIIMEALDEIKRKMAGREPESFRG
jgi:HEAT repeats